MTILAEPGRRSSRQSTVPAKWGGSKLLPGLHRPLSRYLPVLALTVLRTYDSRTQILVGVRNPQTNRTHQNVTSVPTRRVPVLLANEWKRLIHRGVRQHPQDYPGLRSEITSLLSSKLGLADPLELGLVRFRIGAIGASQGVSVIGEDPDGAPHTENLTMFNTAILLEEGDDEVPEFTASYSSLVWADVEAFSRMVRSRDVGHLNAGLENAFSCAYGLCLQTSLAILNGPAAVTATETPVFTTCPEMEPTAHPPWELAAPRPSVVEPEAFASDALRQLELFGI